MRPLLLLLAAGLVMGCSGASVARGATGEQKASAAEEKEAPPASKDAKKKPQGAGQAPVYTNEDLERMFGSSSAPKPEAVEERAPAAAPDAAPATRDAAKKPAPVAKDAVKKPAPSEGDALKALEDAQARDADQKLHLTEAERAVAEASARVRELEKRALAIRNPFLPRPELPPEEAEAWKGLGSEERLRRTEAQLEEARKQLEEARARLAAVGPRS